MGIEAKEFGRQKRLSDEDKGQSILSFISLIRFADCLFGRFEFQCSRMSAIDQSGEQVPLICGGRDLHQKHVADYRRSLAKPA